MLITEALLALSTPSYSNRLVTRFPAGASDRAHLKLARRSTHARQADRMERLGIDEDNLFLVFMAGISLCALRDGR